jgi:hypothetical protein
MESSTTNTRFTPSQKRIGKTALAYAAAMLDGEGSIAGGVLTRGDKQYGFAYVGIINTDIRLHDWLIDTFHGTLKKSTPSRWSKKQCYHWTPADKVWFLKLVRPFMKLKQQQADCAIALHSLPWGAVEKKLRLARKIQALNREKIESSSPATDEISV